MLQPHTARKTHPPPTPPILTLPLPPAPAPARSLKDWKQLELFEREAQLLASLAHKGIPQYLDYFEDDSEADRAFFLVQVSVLVLLYSLSR